NAQLAQQPEEHAGGQHHPQQSREPPMERLGAQQLGLDLPVSPQHGPKWTEVLVVRDDLVPNSLNPLSQRHGRLAINYIAVVDEIETCSERRQIYARQQHGAGDNPPGETMAMRQDGGTGVGHEVVLERARGTSSRRAGNGRERIVLREALYQRETGECQACPRWRPNERMNLIDCFSFNV